MEVSIGKPKNLWALMNSIPDPEIPVISIVDLGIVRDITLQENETIVTITPTYSGCPAMELIKQNIRAVLDQNGYPSAEIRMQLSPAWTTDWISEHGKEKLREYGIAPPAPAQAVCDQVLFATTPSVQCPRCHSFNTKLISSFGSTPCKSLHKCTDCLEPFESFKCH